MFYYIVKNLIDCFIQIYLLYFQFFTELQLMNFWVVVVFSQNSHSQLLASIPFYHCIGKLGKLGKGKSALPVSIVG